MNLTLLKQELTKCKNYLQELINQNGNIGEINELKQKILDLELAIEKYEKLLNLKEQEKQELKNQKIQEQMELEKEDQRLQNRPRLRR